MSPQTKMSVKKISQITQDAYALKTLRVGLLGSAFLFCAAIFAEEDRPPASSYNEVKSFMSLLATQYPGTTKIFILGDSDSGEKIQGVMIGSGLIKNLVVATHHGNEYGSTEVAKAFAASVAQNPIPGRTLYIVPVLNISGYNALQRRESVGFNTYDPNRDYPGPCGTEGPHRLKSTRALAQFVERENIVASATLHTYYPAVVYPWGMSTHDLSTPYDDLFKTLVQAATVESHYEVGNSTEVIYPADGTFEDYAFWKHGVWSLLFELGFSHSPSQGDIKEMIRVNVPGLRRMMEQTPHERATDHDFKGKCDLRMRGLDRHDE